MSLFKYCMHNRATNSQIYSFNTGQNGPNQIKSLLLSHHHSTSALVSEILTSVLQTTIHIWTVHIYRLYRRQCAKYIYSVHTVYYKDILSYRYTLYTVCTHLHYVHIYTLSYMKVQQIIIYSYKFIGCATDSCAKVQQIMHMQCNVHTNGQICI